MKDVTSDNKAFMPSRAAEYLCRQSARLVKAGRLTPDGAQRIYFYCGVRPGYADWRAFLVPVFGLLGLLSLVAGAVFFVAWNWAQMPKMTKFALAEALILALAIVVWWRWYDGLARSALLALGLCFGALFALYGQIYQTGADSWELFRAWLCVLLPLSLIARQNSLWFCSWLVGNLAFQLYYFSLSSSLIENASLENLVYLPAAALYSYLAVQTLCLVVREVLAFRAIKHPASGWLSSRWFSRVMAGFLLLTLTAIVAENISDWGYGNRHPLVMGYWGITLAAGYLFYRYRYPDLCMLTLGTASIVAVGCVFILQLFGNSYDIGGLFVIGCLMALWLTGGGALLLHWRRKLYEREPAEVSDTELTVLMAQLHQHGLLSQTQREDLQNLDHSSHLPWYLRLTLGIGGWVAAMVILFLLVLILYVTGLLDDPGAATVIIPSLLLAAVAGVLLRSKGTGKHHIGLAWAIAATCGLSLGLYLLDEPDWDATFLVGSLCCLTVLAVLLPVMPDRTYRFMAIAAMTFFLIISGNALAALYLPPVAVLCLVSALVACVVMGWLWSVREQLNLQITPVSEFVLPLIYGIPAGLILLCLSGIDVGFFNEIFGYSSRYFTLSTGLGAGIAVGILLSALYQAISLKTPSAFMSLAAAVICGAAALYAPGIGLGLWTVMMARYQGSHGTLVAGGSFLILYVIGWYYFLGVSLLQKSLLLFTGGLVLLVLAIAVKKLLPVRRGAAYAD